MASVFAIIGQWMDLLVVDRSDDDIFKKAVAFGGIGIPHTYRFRFHGLYTCMILSSCRVVGTLVVRDVDVDRFEYEVEDATASSSFFLLLLSDTTAEPF